MADIAEFISAQLDEDERIARAAEATELGPWLTLFETALAAVGQSEDVRRAIGQHLARFTPGRALWDVESKRRILAEHRPGEYGECVVCDVGAQSCGCCGHGDWPCATVRLLALPYAGKPGYQEDWRP